MGLFVDHLLVILVELFGTCLCSHQLCPFFCFHRYSRTRFASRVRATLPCVLAAPRNLFFSVRGKNGIAQVQRSLPSESVCVLFISPLVLGSSFCDLDFCLLQFGVCPAMIPFHAGEHPTTLFTSSVYKSKDINCCFVYSSCDFFQSRFAGRAIFEMCSESYFIMAKVLFTFDAKESPLLAFWSSNDSGCSAGGDELIPIPKLFRKVCPFLRPHIARIFLFKPSQPCET